MRASYKCPVSWSEFSRETSKDLKPWLRRGSQTLSKRRAERQLVRTRKRRLRRKMSRRLSRLRAAKLRARMETELEKMLQLARKRRGCSGRKRSRNLRKEKKCTLISRRRLGYQNSPIQSLCRASANNFGTSRPIRSGSSTMTSAKRCSKILPRATISSLSRWIFAS